jgi:hypothetical protein
MELESQEAEERKVNRRAAHFDFGAAWSLHKHCIYTLTVVQ